MSTLLQNVLEELKETGEVANQKQLGDALKLTKGYVSMLMKQSESLPPKVQTALHMRYNISQTWLATNGAEGSMREGVIGGESAAIPVIENADKKAVDMLLKMLQKEQDNVKRLTIALAEKDTQLAEKDKQIEGLITHLSKTA